MRLVRHRRVAKKAPLNAGSFFGPFYLRGLERGAVGAGVDWPGEGMGATVLPKALPAFIGPGGAAAGPVVLHVGVSFTVEPTDGATYEPTDGATVDPYPEGPACASANVLGRAKTVASTIVLSFMGYPSRCPHKRQPHRLFDRSTKSSLSAPKAARPFTSRRASDHFLIKA